MAGQKSSKQSEKALHGFQSRCFTNHYMDFNGNDLDFDAASLKSQILKHLDTITREWKKTNENCDGGLYVGLAGAAYTFFRLSKLPEFSSNKDFLLNQANDFMKPALDYSNHRTKQQQLPDCAAFLLGNAGVYAVASVLAKSLGNSEISKDYLLKFSSLSKILIPVNWLSCGGDEFLVGRAGYLAGVLWLQFELGCQVLEELNIFRLLDAMLESGQQYSKAHRNPMPLMYAYYGTEYLGAAHGLAGILQLMLSFPNWLSQRPKAISLIKDSIDSLLLLRKPSGNFPAAMDDLDVDKLVHWCHGAPGTVYLLIKAYLVFKEEKYLAASLDCGELVWQRGLLKKGPGICHGVAGNAYVFLVLYRLTMDKRHLYRAHLFEKFLSTETFLKDARIPDCPYSLYEGLCGTVCFMSDLFNPEKSHFPFFDIF